MNLTAKEKIKKAIKRINKKIKWHKKQKKEYNSCFVDLQVNITILELKAIKMILEGKDNE